MLLKHCILAVLATPLVKAMRKCGTPSPTPQEIQAAADSQPIGTDVETLLASGTSIVVNVYFHVVAESDKLEGGYVPKRQIERQLDALNGAFNPYNINFKWGGTQHVIMPAWADNCQELEMKQFLQKGTSADLNVYILPKISCVNQVLQPDDEAVGAAVTIPGYIPSSPSIRARDAVHIRADTLPGSLHTPFGMGMTLVHEAGHWFGLLHTFQGGCFGAGDEISDTPPQYTASQSGSCVPADTCPGGGKDPIENYMDYSDDICYTSFTPKQVIRMHDRYAKYRAPYKEN